MSEKLIRACLAVALCVIGLLLLKPAATKQVLTTANQSAPTQPVMVVDNATLYVLANNKISVYYWDGPATKTLKPQIGQLQLLQTLDVNPQQPNAVPNK